MMASGSGAGTMWRGQLIGGISVIRWLRDRVDKRRMAKERGQCEEDELRGGVNIRRDG